MNVSIIIPILIDLELYYGQLLIISGNSILLILGMGSIEAIFILISTVSLFFWGFLIDRYDRQRWTIIGILLIIGGTMTIILFSKFISGYIIGRFIIGIGIGVFIPVSYSLAGDIVNYKNRGVIGGGLSIATISGAGIAILIGGALGSISLFFPFYFLLLLAILMLIISYFWHPEPIRGQNEPEIQSMLKKQDPNKTRNVLNGYSELVSVKVIWLLLKKRTNLIMFLQGIFALMPSVILSYYLISFLHDSRFGGIGLQLSLATILSIGLASGRLFGYLFWGYLGDYLQRMDHSLIKGRGRVIVASLTMICQGPLMILAFMIPLSLFENEKIMLPHLLIENQNFLLFGIIFFFAAFVGAGSGPNRRSITYDINLPEFRGQASSLFSIGDQLGASIGLSIGYILILSFNYNSAFILLSIGYFIAGLIWLIALRTIREDQDALRGLMELRKIELNL